MKHYEIKYWLPNQSRLFSRPQQAIAKSWREKADILSKCEANGYDVEDVREFEPVPAEERFYA